MVKRLGGQRFCDAQPDCGTPEQLAAAWQDFCQAKYAATDREEQRPELEDLGPPSERSSQVPTDEELELCFSALKSSKAVGADELPVEVYRAAPSAKEALFDLVKRICREEVVPAAEFPNPPDFEGGWNVKITS